MILEKVSRRMMSGSLAVNAPVPSNTRSGQSLSGCFASRLIHLVVLMSSLSTTMAWAEDEQDQPVIVPDEIIVTATRVEKRVQDVAAAIGVVRKQDIQLGRQQLGLDESLSAIPGLFMQDRYNFAQDLRIAIRGFGARSNFGIRGVKILVDGIPESLPDGQGQSDGIDLGSAEQIEVLRGPSSSLYGNASGGVINITSEKGPEDPFAELRLNAGAFGFKQAQLKVGGEAGRLNYLVNLSDMRFDGYRTHSETENTQLTTRLRFKIDQTSDLSVAVGLTDQPLANDPGGVTRAAAEADPTLARAQNVDFDAGEALEQQRVGFSYQKTFGAEHTLRLRNHYVWRDFSNRLPFVGGGAVAFDRRFLGGGGAYTYKGELWGRPNTFIVGADLDQQNDDRRRFDNNNGVAGALTLDQDETVASVGVFAQSEWSISDSVAMTIGLRFDDVSFDVEDNFLVDGDDSGERSFRETSPMVSAVWTPFESTSLYATVSTSFETPTTTELANPNGQGGFSGTIAPQRAKNYEVGIKGQIGERHRYDLALFDISVEDELIPFELADQPGREFFANAGESSRHGLEVSVVSQPIDGLTMSLAYTYSDFAFTRFIDANGNDFSGNVLPGIPDNLLRAEAMYRHSSGAYASLEAFRAGSFFANNANTETNDSYVVTNLRAGLQDITFNQWAISPFFGINNLNNERYFANVRINAFGGRFFEAAPDRHVYAGVAIRFDARRDR